MHAEPAVHKWVGKLIYATFCEHDRGSRLISSLCYGTWNIKAYIFVSCFINVIDLMFLPLPQNADEKDIDQFFWFY